MHLEITTCGETTVTNWTLVGSFPCVRTEMNLQGRITAEHFPTKAAGMLETTSTIGAG